MPRCQRGLPLPLPHRRRPALAGDLQSLHSATRQQVAIPHDHHPHPQRRHVHNLRQWIQSLRGSAVCEHAANPTLPRRHHSREMHRPQRARCRTAALHQLRRSQPPAARRQPALRPLIAPTIHRYRWTEPIAHINEYPPAIARALSFLEPYAYPSICAGPCCQVGD